MKIHPACCALMIGAALALSAPWAQLLAQSRDTTVLVAASTSHNVGATKNRYWRHRGGKHPHYGSRRVRTR